MEAAPNQLSFAAVHPVGIYGRLPRDATLRFLDQTEERWTHKGYSSPWEMRRFALSTLVALRPRTIKRNHLRARPYYVTASPNNLTNEKLVGSILQRERARFICLLHDLIPLQYPEYAREGGAADHGKRIRTILKYAAGIVCNSQATADALAPWMDRLHAHPALVVAHLGTHARPVITPEVRDGRPYFICVGTIEPRKNHLLLLNLWRRMSEERGAENIPRLVIVGRRGWENEQIVDMLERCPALKGCVDEEGRLSDREVTQRMSGAQALLMPSFAEGYGMPVAEALDLGVPVICSDLPALREAGGAAPTFLDPLDGPGWQRAIDDHCRTHKRQQVMQIPRAERTPSWRSHIAIVLDLLHRLSS